MQSVILNIETAKLYLMKKLLLFTLLLLWINGLQAQGRLRHSRAYIGGILQEGRFGGSLILSYGINQYLGIGAGVDITSFKSTSYPGSNNRDARFFAPFYADLRLKYPTKHVEPFIFGQFGKPAYSESFGRSTDMTGQPGREVQQTGKYFYGAGLGLSSVKRRVGAFVSVAYRLYAFNYSPDQYVINGRNLLDPKDESMLIISAGLVF